MYALRYYRMFVRNDGFMTDNKAAMKLFDTVEEAETYVVGWRAGSGVRQSDPTVPVEIVEVETKIVCQKIGKVVMSR